MSMLNEEFCRSLMMVRSDILDSSFHFLHLHDARF